MFYVAITDVNGKTRFVSHENEEEGYSLVSSFELKDTFDFDECQRIVTWISMDVTKVEIVCAD